MQEERKKFMQEYSNKPLSSLKMLKIEWSCELSQMESDTNGKIVTLFIATISLLISFFSLVGVDFPFEERVVVFIYFVSALIFGISYFVNLSRYPKRHRLKYWQLSFLSELISYKEHLLCKHIKIKLIKL